MAGQPKRRTRGIPWWGSLLIYVLLSVLMTWPLALNLNSHFGSTDTDMYNVYWGNWWVPHALASGQSPYFTNYLIYPVGFNLTTFAFSPLLALLNIPLSWIASPIAAYNVLMWLTIVLCSLAMDQLVRDLTGDAWAALAAAVTFAFAPRLVAERASHLNMAFVVWLPWSVLLLTKLVREAKSPPCGSTGRGGRAIVSHAAAGRGFDRALQWRLFPGLYPARGKAMDRADLPQAASSWLPGRAVPEPVSSASVASVPTTRCRVTAAGGSRAEPDRPARLCPAPAPAPHLRLMDRADLRPTVWDQPPLLGICRVCASGAGDLCPHLTSTAGTALAAHRGGCSSC